MRIYGEDAERWTKIVDEGLHELFLEYIVLSHPAPTCVDQRSEGVPKVEISHKDTSLSSGDRLIDFDVYILEINM